MTKLRDAEKPNPLHLLRNQGRRQ